MTRWCGVKTSLRNGWLNQTARSDPVRSRSSTSKILKRGPPRRPDAAADDLADDGGRLRRAQRGDGLEVAAILVANRKAVEQVFDGVETDAFEIGGAPRADAFQILQRRLKRLYCTTIASPFSRRGFP